MQAPYRTPRVSGSELGALALRQSSPLARPGHTQCALWCFLGLLHSTLGAAGLHRPMQALRLDGQYQTPSTTE